jgi:hypothetical protein
VPFHNRSTLRLSKDNLPYLLPASNLSQRDFDEYIPFSVAENPLSRYSSPEYLAKYCARVFDRVSSVEINPVDRFDSLSGVFSGFHAR